MLPLKKKPMTPIKMGSEALGMRGIVAFYKPRGMTSHDVVDWVRRKTGERTVGHAGTLDPLARGVLVVGIGREATKRLGTIEKTEKEYIAEIRLGMTSVTDDEEGTKTLAHGATAPTENAVTQMLKDFQGNITQTPPMYSALKVAGKAAYAYARAGKPVQLKPREVLIKEIELLSYNWPLLRLRVVTGPGVYIRALARDLGKSSAPAAISRILNARGSDNSCKRTPVR